MKDLGEENYILGIRIYRDRSRRLIGLSQSTYLDKVLKRFNMESSKKGFLPMSHGVKLSKTQCPSTTDERSRMSAIPYSSALGSIMYAMICTRPDVSYALSMTSRYQADLGGRLNGRPYIGGGSFDSSALPTLAEIRGKRTSSTPEIERRSRLGLGALAAMEVCMS